MWRDILDPFYFDCDALTTVNNESSFHLNVNEAVSPLIPCVPHVTVTVTDSHAFCAKRSGGLPVLQVSDVLHGITRRLF